MSWLFSSGWHSILLLQGRPVSSYLTSKLFKSFDLIKHVWVISLFLFLHKKYVITNLKGCPTNRMSLIFSSNLSSHNDGWAAKRFERTLFEKVDKLSAFSDSHSLPKFDKLQCKMKDLKRGNNGWIYYNGKFWAKFLPTKYMLLTCFDWRDLL